jgi:hypothetical protein
MPRAPSRCFLRASRQCHAPWPLCCSRWPSAGRPCLVACVRVRLSASASHKGGGTRGRGHRDERPASLPAGRGVEVRRRAGTEVFGSTAGTCMALVLGGLQRCQRLRRLAMRARRAPLNRAPPIQSTAVLRHSPISPMAAGHCVPLTVLSRPSPAADPFWFVAVSRGVRQRRCLAPERAGRNLRGETCEAEDGRHP